MEGDEFQFEFERLDVYWLAVDLAAIVLSITETWGNKHLRLASQFESAAASVAQNIAEGKGRQYGKEYVQFLYIARGSLYEVVSLTEVLQRRQIISPEQHTELRHLMRTIMGKLSGLINSLKRGNGA